MNRALDFIRRHARLFAGLAVVVLAAGVAFALGSAGAVHAQTPQTVARASQTGAKASRNATAAAVAHASSASPASSVVPVAATTTVRSTTPGSGSHHAGRSGVPAAPPTSRGVALALRRSTGLAPSQVTTRQLCPAAASGHAKCAAAALVLRSDGALVHPRVARASLNAPVYGNAPAYLQQAYDLSSLAQKGGGGDTVAIVDAYDDPTAESDLSAYRSFYNLPACTTANGCFRKVNETGGSTPPSTTNAGWDQEISLDLDAVSAICPNCHILLVEANSTLYNDMQTAVQTAATDGANQISASWTIGLSQAPPAQDFTFPGIATVAATGDAGYVEPGQDNFPAALPGVTAAGGTTLAPASGAPNPRGFTEGAWSGGGSGCATEVTKPAYQSDTGCTGRSYADLSADADPNTGLAVYDNGSWLEIGGTSLATPVIAAYYAITGVADSSPQWAYGDSAALNDVVSGSNGSNCVPSYICNAGLGYDGPTGVGSISGAAVSGPPGIGAPSIPGTSANTYTESTRSDGATITGGIYPNGLDTTWWLQYWPQSGGPAQQTAAADIGSGTAPVAVTGYPSHLTPGVTYDYELVAKNSAGTTSGAVYTFTTSAGSATAPRAAFTSSGTPSTPGAAVSFNASGSTDSGARITDYSWDFGDGTTQDAQHATTASHAYANPGTYNVTLIVTNSKGQSETTTQAVTVDAVPVASLTASPNSPTPGSTVTFDASGSTDSVGQVTGYSWSVDGAPAVTGPSQQSYTFGRGSHTVSVTVTNDAGQTDTTSQTVIVDDPPTASVTASPTVSTPGSTVNFDPTATSPDASSGGSITGYSWNFGDPSSDTNTASSQTAAPASHTYSSPGVYPVTLTVTDDLGITSTATTQITVDSVPVASLAASSNSPTPGSTVTFDASGSTDSVGQVTGYSWSVDGAPAVTGPSQQSYTFDRGSHTVSVTVTNDAGQSDTTSQTVVVDDPPTASVTASAPVTTPGSTVTFDPTATSPDANGSITRYSWNFGDPGSASNADSTQTALPASHTYSSPGVYPVTLTVTDDLGITQTATTQITVDAAPTAAFTTSANPATAGATVTFDGSGSTDPVGQVTGYSWNFGDPGANNTATGKTATHSFGRGTYTVTLTVTNDAGQSATSTQTVTVDDPPTASVTASAPVTTPGATVTFDSAASPEAGGSITAYSWNFGDPTSASNTASTQNASHTYGSPGVYAVTLTVTDDLGITQTATTQITVDAAPKAAFTTSANPATAGSAVSFDASGSSDSVGTITGYRWNFGDPGSTNDTATGRAPSHVYETPGTYTVSLTVTNDAGQSSTRTSTVTVNSIPSPAPTSPPSSSPAPAPTPAPAPAPKPAPAPAPTTPLSASLGAAKKQKLAPVLAHGLRLSIAASQGTRASFQITLPVSESRLAHSARKPKTRSIVLLRTGAQTLGAGAHPITLRLSRKAAGELAATGPLVVTVQVTLTEPSGAKITRTVKVTLTRSSH